MINIEQIESLIGREWDDIDEGDLTSLIETEEEILIERVYDNIPREFEVYDVYTNININININNDDDDIEFEHLWVWVQDGIIERIS